MSLSLEASELSSVFLKHPLRVRAHILCAFSLLLYALAQQSQQLGGTKLGELSHVPRLTEMMF